jgi:hypothetical protein
MGKLLLGLTSTIISGSGSHGTLGVVHLLHLFCTPGWLVGQIAAGLASTVDPLYITLAQIT